VEQADFGYTSWFTLEVTPAAREDLRIVNSNGAVISDGTIKRTPNAEQTYVLHISGCGEWTTYYSITAQSGNLNKIVSKVNGNAVTATDNAIVGTTANTLVLTITETGMLNITISRALDENYGDLIPPTAEYTAESFVLTIDPAYRPTLQITNGKDKKDTIYKVDDNPITYLLNVTGADETTEYAIVNGNATVGENDIASIDRTTGKLTIRGIGTITVRVTRQPNPNYGEDPTADGTPQQDEFTLTISEAKTPGNTTDPKTTAPLTGGEIAGITTGIAGFAALDATLAYFCLLRPKRLKRNRAKALLDAATKGE
jgi:hypothetical protein